METIYMNYKIAPPSEFLAKTLSDEIRSVAGDAETQKDLHDSQLAIIRQQNWFNLYVPKAYGGLGLALPEILKVEECVSWADGSTAWVITLCSGAAWFIGFLDTELANDIFSNKLVCIAGSGAVSGTASKSVDGYEINGYWKHATGSLHATAFTVNCEITEKGSPVRNEDGTPMVQSFVLMPDEVAIHKTWHSMGMIATGTHAMEIKNIRVPLNRMFIIDPAQAKLKHDIFQFPFLQLAETTLAVNLSGMAYRFVELAQEIFMARTPGQEQRRILLDTLDREKDLLNSVRQDFYTLVDSAWERLTKDKKINAPLLDSLSDISLKLSNCSRQIVTNLYPYTGLSAADTRNEINRIWRNIHTAGQHNLFNRRNIL
jgi:alkylation response protein AidB-like acyl-CoA dehydrogenase